MISNKMLTNNNTLPLSPVQQFFAGSTIFVTGATGFMGKCLLEKLLRSCPDLDKIYILVREKKGKKGEGRVEELFKDVLFSELHANSDKHRCKVVSIAGDVSAPGLGLSPQNRALLQREVNVVFHGAATVNFNEKLRLAVAININGTKEVLDLCKGMSNLKSLVHISTIYSNCHIQTITEKFYKYHISYKDLPTLISKLDDKSLEDITPQILGDWPNTYAFSKALAESLVEEYRGLLPVSVFRPGIVLSTWKEPLQGWIDNVYGPTGFCVGAMMGVLGSTVCDARLKTNIVPVDYVVNALIVCAWETGRKGMGGGEGVGGVVGVGGVGGMGGEDVWEKEADNELGSMYKTPNFSRLKHESDNETDPLIFNYVGTVEKPLNWGVFHSLNNYYATVYPLKDALWCVNCSITNSNFIHTMKMFFLHFIPAVLVDGVSLIIGKKPRLLKIYNKTDKFIKMLTHFCVREWHFSNDNTQQLWRTLDLRDKEIFPFSMADMDWHDYFKTYVYGIRKYLIKDDDSTIPAAILKQKRIWYVSQCLKLAIGYICVYYIFCMFKNICGL